jgi:hypothetical protein
MTTPSQHLSPPPPLQDIPLSHEASKSSTAADVLKEDRCNASSACIQGHNPGSRVSRHVLGTDRLNCLLQVSCNCLLQLFVTGFPHQYAHTHTRAHTHTQTHTHTHTRYLSPRKAHAQQEIYRHRMIPALLSSSFPFPPFLTTPASARPRTHTAPRACRHRIADLAGYYFSTSSATTSSLSTWTLDWSANMLP